MVGTTNKSMAATSGACLRKKVRHPRRGGRRRLTMYLATLDCATSNPSLSNSPWIRGAPQSGFSTLIRRTNARSSVSICGRPPRGRDFQRQYPRKPARCQRTSVSGRMIVRTCRIDGNQRYSWIKNQRSWFVSRTRPCSLGFKTQLRLEWRGQDGQNETEQPDHSASLGDSITSSTGIRFSVHTGVAGNDAETCDAFSGVYATDERAGSVDWIEYPATGSRSGLAMFFSQDRMIGIGRRNCGTCAPPKTSASRSPSEAALLGLLCIDVQHIKRIGEFVRHLHAPFPSGLELAV